MDVMPMPTLSAGEAFGPNVARAPQPDDGDPRPPVRRRPGRTAGMVAAAVICMLPIAAFAALFVASLVFDVPIDLPPGDVYSLTIENNTSGPVDAFMCDDPTCNRGVWPETIQPGHHNLDSFNEDQYTPSAVGLADPVTHKLLGCLTPPRTNSFSKPLPTTHVVVSSIHACGKHSDSAHPVVNFYDPLAS